MWNEINYLNGFCNLQNALPMSVRDRVTIHFSLLRNPHHSYSQKCTTCGINPIATLVMKRTVTAVCIYTGLSRRQDYFPLQKFWARLGIIMALSSFWSMGYPPLFARNPYKNNPRGWPGLRDQCVVVIAEVAGGGERVEKGCLWNLIFYLFTSSESVQPRNYRG